MLNKNIFYGLLFSVIVFSSKVDAQTRNVYFGRLHSHTHYSDGQGTPEDAFKKAKEAGLDFFAVTEHNHDQAAGSDGIFLTPPLYHKLKYFANAATVNGKFVAIWGQEVSTISAGNHQNIFYSSEICDMPKGNFKYLYETWLPNHPQTSFVQLNHPRGEPKAKTIDYGIDDYHGDFDSLVSASDRYIQLIEVIKGSAQSGSQNSGHRQGAYENEYFYYLNKGFHIGPSVGGDNHKKNWGKSMEGRMGVWATELSRDGIEEAILGHHCYASEDDSIKVNFTVNNKIMGSKIKLSQSETVSLKVTFSDHNEPNAKHRVEIYYDDAKGGDVLKRIENEFFDAGVNEASFVHTAKPGAYVLAKITQIGDHPDDVWTAPIWFVDGEGGTPIAGTNTDDPPMDKIRWNQAGDYIEETITVSGKIIRAHNHEDKIIFFNFDRNYEDTLTLILFKEDFAHFGSADSIINRLSGKKITVHGKIGLYQNSRMQMRLNDKAQIIAIDD